MAGSTWRESFGRRLSGLVIAAVAEAIAIAVVVTGPAEPLAFDVRLPLLVLVIGGIAVAVRRRRMIVIERENLVVRTPARTRRIPWPAVASVRPRTNRITIRERNGRGVTLRTGADTEDVADAIEAELAVARADLAVGADQRVADPQAADPLTVGPQATVGAAPTLATPWLVLNGTMGVAFLAAKGYQSHPTLMAGVLGFGGGVCLATLGGCLVQWLRSPDVT